MSLCRAELQYVLVTKRFTLNARIVQFFRKLESTLNHRQLGLQDNTKHQ